ncbi:MAG: hypothetical protein ACLGIC_03965 [Acidimicrobiia bacterium]
MTEERPRRTVPAGAFVVALMVAVALGVLAVVALASGGGDGSTSSDQDVRLAAGRFTERFLTFRHDALDEWQQEVLALSTRGFAEEVEDVESSLRALIGEGRLDATTQVTDVFVGEEDRGAVGVVVVYDRTVDGEGGERTETDRYVELALVRIDGRWLVDNVIDIASSEGLGGAVAPGATATSVP